MISGYLNAQKPKEKTNDKEIHLQRFHLGLEELTSEQLTTDSIEHTELKCIKVFCGYIEMVKDGLAHKRYTRIR